MVALVLLAVVVALVGLPVAVDVHRHPHIEVHVEFSTARGVTPFELN